tara:strand:- start:669 stop:1598 length:930 start_codon:yes stop_codon:yes gene_type:complete
MMRAFEQAWALLKADPLAQGGMGSLRPDTLISMIERQRREGAQGLPFVDFSGATKQGYPTVMQDITPLGETTMSRMGSGRNLDAYESIPITETMPEEAFMTQPERSMARRGLGAARRRMESGARGPTGQGMTPYRTKEGMLASNVGVASPTRLRIDTKPVETQQERTGKPTLAQNTADILAQFAQQQNTEFDRPAEIDLKPEPKSGGFNEQIDTAGRGGRRALRTRQSIENQPNPFKPQESMTGFTMRPDQPQGMGPRLAPMNERVIPLQTRLRRTVDPDSMNEERLLELARQLGKQNGAQQTAVDRTA